MAKTTDITRAERKAKKRALEAAVPDLPGDNQTSPKAQSIEESTKKKRKRDGEDNGKSDIGGKKHKGGVARAKNTEDPASDTRIHSMQPKHTDEVAGSEPTTASNFAHTETQNPDSTIPKKSKKERKAERRARETVAENHDEVSGPAIDSLPELAGNFPKDESEAKRPKKNNRNREKKRNGSTVTSNTTESASEKGKKEARFIVFVGNLPFTATTSAIEKHFSKVQPSSVRHLVKKDDPSKSRGCAFVEFDGYDHMKTCLKLFHHSMFNDGLSPPRKINVELTAGGGGNGKDRKTKIQQKNVKLNEERIRRMQEEEKAKIAKANTESHAAHGDNTIHPSRRRMIPGAG